MREDLLHFVWKYQKLPLSSLQTTDGETVLVKKVGIHNHGEGPDFFNARLLVGAQEWAGNVELHLKSSDWYAHGHESDSKYDNVVLHVVWEDDMSVFRKDGTQIPTLALKNYISQELLDSYQKLFKNARKTDINCGRHIVEIDHLLLGNWMDRLFFERLEQKSDLVFELLDDSKNDWEKALFVLLMKSFGSNLNGDAFVCIAKALDFSIVRKVAQDAFQLEALLLGMAGLLPEVSDDEYVDRLKSEFAYLVNKFDLDCTGIPKPAFYGLRPHNFPTIRLAQMAALYHKTPALFAEVIAAKDIDAISKVFDVAASAYWDSHFTLSKSSRKSKKRLTQKFIELLVINAVVPIKFCHAKRSGKDIGEELVTLISDIRPENNSIIKKFISLGLKSDNALQSQAMIQLYNQYCTKNRCLQCAVGTGLLNGNF